MISRKYFISLIGIDGSGKSTQARLLVNNLKQNGIDALYVYNRWEPFLLRPFINLWNNRFKKRSDNINNGIYKIKLESKRKILNKQFLNKIWLFTFFIDYGIQVFRKIYLQQFRGKIIVSDRIFYDSLIDKAADLGRDIDWLSRILDSFLFKIFFPKPDMVIYIDCPESIAISRKNDIPNLEYLISRRELYLKLSEKYGWVKINGALPIDTIENKIKKLVFQFLEKVGG